MGAAENGSIDLQKEFNFLEKLIAEAWGSFITSRTTEGMNSIQYIIGAFEKLFQYTGDRENNAQNTSYLLNFNSLFMRMEDAMKIPDYILLGDLLKYEVLPLVKKWRIDLEEDCFAAK